MFRFGVTLVVALLLASVGNPGMAGESGTRDMTVGGQVGGSDSIPMKKVKVGERVGESVHDLKLRDLQKGWFFRLSDYCHPGEGRSYQQKKTVVLDFFATNCSQCVKMLPRLVDFATRRGDSVQVLLIAVPERDDVNGRKLRSFFERNPVPFPVLEDPSSYVSLKWLPEVDGVASMPYLFLVDREGVVRAEVPGYHDSIDAALSPALEAALKP